MNCQRNFRPATLSGLFLLVAFGMGVGVIMFVSMFMIVNMILRVAGETILVRNWIFEEDGFWWEKGKSEIHNKLEGKQKC